MPLEKMFVGMSILACSQISLVFNDGELRLYQKVDFHQMQVSMVEVFRTNIEEEELAKQLTLKLSVHFPHCKINFDLQDCDNILRVEGKQIVPEEIIELVTVHGYECQVLD